MLPTLPVELTDSIIACVDDGPRTQPVNVLQQTLCNCALVCRDWLPASRHHLFKSVFILSDVQYTLFVARVVHSDRMRPWLSSTEHLTLGNLTNPPPSSSPTGGAAPQPSPWQQLPHELAAQFPNLRALSIRGSSPRDADDLAPQHTRALALFLSSHPRLRALSLKGWDFPSFSAFCRAVAALPALADLTLVHVGWVTDPARTDAFIAAWPARAGGGLAALASVTLFYHRIWPRAAPCAKALLAWLAVATPPGASVRALDAPAWCLSVAAPFWERVGPGLTKLALDLRPAGLWVEPTNGLAHARNRGRGGRPGYEPPWRARSLDAIAHLTSLRSLECTISAFRREDQWEELADALSAVRSRPEEIVIRMQLNVRETDEGLQGGFRQALRDMPAQLLDASLEREAFGDLGALVFIAFGRFPWGPWLWPSVENPEPYASTDLLRALQAMFPKACSRYDVTASAELE